MKRNFRASIGFLLLVVGSLLVGCGGAPSGTDADVKELVLDIVRDELRDQLAPLLYQKVTNVPVALMGVNVTYEALMENIDQERNADVIREIDTAIAGMSMSLENIRMDSIDDQLKKSQSSADLILNNKRNPISYTAQITSDGNLYVEVFGL